MSVSEPNETARACMIWMHGLGADGQDMAGLVRELPLTIPVKHVFLDAPVRPVTLNNGMPMRAWYDITGVSLTAREDKVGILDSEQRIVTVIEEQSALGFSSEHIILAGFSQGGAMALFTGLRYAQPLGGIIALSAYLPLANECVPTTSAIPPLFLALGTQDMLVQPAWTRQTRDWLVSKGAKAIPMHEYPMGHSVCVEELNDLARWLARTIISDKVTTKGTPS